MKLDINNTAPTFRDAILKKNLYFSESILKNGLVNYAVGLGKQVQIGSYPDNIKSQTKIEDTSPIYSELNTSTNKYQSNSDPNLTNINTKTQKSKNEGEYDSSKAKLTKNEDLINYLSSKNKYKDTEQQNQFTIKEGSTNNLQNENKDYLKQFSFQSGDDVSNQPINVLGGFIRGNNALLTNDNSISTSFDIKNTLAGRTLGGLGVINDTPLARIAAKQLLINLTNKVGSKFQNKTKGRINTNLRDLLSGGNLVNPNYTITTNKLSDAEFNPSSIFGVFNEGVGNRRNLVTNSSTSQDLIKVTGKGQILELFSNLNKNKYKPNYQDNRTERGLNQETGVESNSYVDIKRVELLNNESTQIALNLASSTFLGFESSFSNEFDDLSNKQYIGFTNNDVNEVRQETKFTWVDSRINKDGKGYSNTFNQENQFTKPKSILYKTQELFNKNKIRTIISGKGLSQSKTNNEIETPGYSVQGTDYISKGSGVLSQSAALRELNGNAEPKDVFCRTWTTFDRYNQIKDLQKRGAEEGGLFSNGGLRFSSIKESVLENNGMPRIAPYVGDDIGNRENPTNIKRFMFSIENLAWDGSLSKLLSSEIGPGDPVTGTRGRIMWFPPYDISFTDNTSVNIDSTTFLGRTEPLYTYSNSERTGTLTFKLVVDHPNYMNELKNASGRFNSNDYINSLIAGCAEIPDDLIRKLTKEEEDNIRVESVSEETTVEDEPETPPYEFYVYFPNDVTTLPVSGFKGNESKNENTNGDDYAGYEDGNGNGLGNTISEKYHAGNADNTEVYPDNTNFGFNTMGNNIPVSSEDDGSATNDSNENWISEGIEESETWYSENFIEKLSEFMVDKCPSCRVEIDGGSSTDGSSGPNEELARDRARNVELWFTENILVNDTTEVKAKRYKRVSGTFPSFGCSPVAGGGEQDRACAKQARFAKVSFVYDPEIKETIEPKEVEESNEAQIRLTDEIVSRFYNEATFFKKLEKNDPFVFETFKERIQFFHPAFHSTTPEGFNSRLNFLSQCTKPGATKDEKNETPYNMSFGTPPVCILRVGDFYHTKIFVTNLSYSFEPLIWDLNPEGIGVQPMICNVDLTFNFIGGSSLEGPINKLQNALSFNFFANTEIYDVRADRIKDGQLELGSDTVESISNTTDESEQEGLSTNNTNGDDLNQTNDIDSETEEIPEEEIVQTRITLDSIEFTETNFKFNILGQNGSIFETTNDKRYEFKVNINLDGSPRTISLSKGIINFDGNEWSVKNTDEVTKDKIDVNNITFSLNKTDTIKNKLTNELDGETIEVEKIAIWLDGKPYWFDNDNLDLDVILTKTITLTNQI